MLGQLRVPVLLSILTLANAVECAWTPGNDGAGAADAAADGEPPLLAVADLHGDEEQALKALRLVGVVNAAGRWAAGNSTLVQTGDVVDREPDSLALLALMERLEAEAAAHGGRVISLLGNHELMNLQGVFGYVAPGELAWLARNVTQPRSAGSTRDRHRSDDTKAGRQLWERRLRVGQTLGDTLRRRRVVALAGSGACRTLFVHAGLAAGLLREAATLARQDLAGLTPGERVALLDEVLTGALRRCFPRGDSCSAADQAAARLLASPDGPLWTRMYRRPAACICTGLDEVLQLTGAKRIVIGHNVQPGGRAGSACGGRLELMDVGISRAYGGHSAGWRCISGTAAALHAGDTSAAVT